MKMVVSGHAGMAPEGHDIVCAGVSSLVNALISWAKRNFENRLDLLSTTAEKGKAFLIASAIQKNGDVLMEVFNLVSNGLEAISATYPGKVRFSRTDKTERSIHD